jgi:hypothetical protein
MHKQQFRTFYLAIASAILLGSLSMAAWARDDAALNQQLTETIAKVRTGETEMIRVDAAKLLVDLTRGANPNGVEDKVLADIVSLLDRPEDSVWREVATALRNLGARGKNAVRSEFIATIAKVRTGTTGMIRADTANHLVVLIRSIDPNDVDDKVLADIVSLLDISEDAIRFEVAAALGNLGPRAKVAVPKLLKILEEVDCLPRTISSALTNPSCSA